MCQFLIKPFSLKKIFAIAMLVLFLFNLGGYQLLFQYFIYESDVSITQQINNNHYKSSELVEVKIPVHLNNFQSWDEFKPVSGQVKVKDNCYNYAALKMTRDTMFLMVIPNHDKARIIYEKNTYAKQVNDNPSGKKSRPQLVKNNISEFECGYIIKYDVLISALQGKAAHSFAFSDIIKTTICVQGQPPETTFTLFS